MGKNISDIKSSGYSFGTFQGVFTPSILTIVGVVMYLRFGWMLGNVGLPVSLLIVTIGSTITFLTALSISSLATNMKMRGGGAYYIISRSLGLEAGAALGIPLAIAQAVSVSFYVSGFVEALVNSGLPVVSTWDPKIAGFATLLIIAILTGISADIALKSQYLIMLAIAISLVSFFLGSAPAIAPANAADIPPKLGFWPVFAVFFPAVTGILSGLGMSGDLKKPHFSIPAGTIAAVLTGYAIYMSIPIVLDHFVKDDGVLRTNFMILSECARWKTPILLGVWAATLSSAVGCFLCSPRAMQALSRDRLLPRWIGLGFGASDDPRCASVVCCLIAAIGIWFGDINIIAPILTLFHLAVYGLLNFCAAMEETMGNPSWRPTFRVKSYLSFAGFLGCLGAMFMISPGWTFISIICQASIYWAVKRRDIKTHWGDMRSAMLLSLIRYSLKKLEQIGHAERNWRPNVLTFCQLPIKSMRILRLTRELSGDVGLATIASVLPNDIISTDIDALKSAVRRSAGRLNLDACIKMISNNDDWTGMNEVIRSYGFGPLTPNTILMGCPEAHYQRQFGEIIRSAMLSQRNILVLDEKPHASHIHKYIDIWWRGGSDNGSLMLAIACLLKRGHDWRDFTLRVNMIVHRRTSLEGETELANFLGNMRINAVTRVIESEGKPFPEVLSGNSQEAALTMIGLRSPRTDETALSYGEYFTYLSSALANVGSALFVLSGENVDFRRIFAE